MFRQRQHRRIVRRLETRLLLPRHRSVAARSLSRPTTSSRTRRFSPCFFLFDTDFNLWLCPVGEPLLVYTLTSRTTEGAWRNRKYKRQQHHITTHHGMTGIAFIFFSGARTTERGVRSTMHEGRGTKQCFLPLDFEACRCSYTGPSRGHEPRCVSVAGPFNAMKSPVGFRGRKEPASVIHSSIRIQPA